MNEVKIYKQKWYLKNRQRCIEKARKNYTAKKDSLEFKQKRSKYYLKNQEHIKAKNRAHRAHDNDIVRASDKRSYEKHRQTRLKKMKEYAELHPETNRIASKRYRENHPERRKLSVIANEGKRRAQKLATDIGDIDYDLLLQEAAGMCAICVLPLEDRWHFDHRIPLSKGGSHTQDNLQVTHPRCNLKKSAKLEYAA